MIVFCHLLNDTSGSPRVLRSVLASLNEAQSENKLLIGNQGRGSLEECGIEIRRYWYRRSRFRIVTLFTYVASQLALYLKLACARDIPADATVYVNTLLPFGAALWGRQTGRRVIYHIHEVSISPGALRWFLTRIAARTANVLFYVSEDHRARLPIPGVRAVTLSNPIGPELQAFGAKTPYAPRRSGRFNVLMLASPRNFKGIPEFLMLARSFRNQESINFTLVLNANEYEIKKYFIANSVPENVTIHPRTTNPAAFYAKADIALNLSRVDQWIETFGLTLAEAMAFGLPVIAPPVGGPSELVSDGVEGYLIDSRDHKALTSAVSKLADDSALCVALSKAARRKAGTLSWAAFAERLRSEVQAVQNNKASS